MAVISLSKNSKNYWVEVRIGWNGWLPNLHYLLYSSTIGQELGDKDYWRRLWWLIKETYGVHYKYSSAIEMADFFLKTGMVVIHLDNKNLTRQQLYNVSYYVRKKVLDQRGIETIIDWLRQGW